MLSVYISSGFKNKFSQYEREIKQLTIAPGMKNIDVLGSSSAQQLIFIAQEFEIENELDRIQPGDIVFKGPAYTNELFNFGSDLALFEIKSEQDWEAALFTVRNELDAHNEEILRSVFSVISKNKAQLNSHIDDLQKTFDDYLEHQKEYLFLNEIFSLSALKLTARFAALRDQDLVRLFVESSLYSIDIALEGQIFQDQALIDSLNRDHLGLLVLGSSQEVVWFNEKFKNSQINPSDMDKTTTKINTDLGRWRVSTLGVQQGFTFYIFMPLEDDSEGENSEDLGIITSSIAHELNNPLGGISAAVDVLLLDEWEGEQMEALQNIKKTVNRCKGLVETFLGFSRRELISDDNLRAAETINQAYELIKFRLIENNYRLLIKHEVQESLKLTCNSSVLTMVFYLIFNELLTFQSHQALISLSNEKSFKLTIIEYRDSIYLKPSIEIDSSELEKNGLLKHLLQLISLALKTTDGLKLIKL